MITRNELLEATNSLKVASIRNFSGSDSLIYQYDQEKSKPKNTIILEYDSTHKVDRVWNGIKKDFYPKYRTNGKWNNGLGDRSEWMPYKYELFTFAPNQWIIVNEGEKATDYALTKGLISTCIVGSAFQDETVINNLINEAKDNGIKGFIYICDNDDQGLKKAKYIQKYCFDTNFPCFIIPIKLLFKEAEVKDDIADWIIKYPSMTGLSIANEIYAIIDALNEQLIDDYFSHEKIVKSNVTVDVTNWLDVGINELFSGHWISLNGHLYKYNGQFYEEKEDGYILRKISTWGRNYIDSKGKKPCSKPSAVKELFTWANQLFWVSPNEVNQGGLPLKNGILRIGINNNQSTVTLDNYSPDDYFTYQSEVSYQPNCDRSAIDRLLQCLDEPYRSLFIQSVSTIIDFQLIKSRWDRIKALMLIGEGSNGKDTLREVVSLILGKKGITGCSLNDFQKGDTGRGFNLLRLATNPKINWSSENRKINIDAIQTLKQAITGDPIYIEAKGKDGFEVELNTLFIFNSNEKPEVKANQKAIQSRLTTIPFEKVYSIDPQEGELKADPRYKHDRQFLINEVCPAMLNLLIEAFGYVYANGIDYTATNEYFEQIALENNHLKRFAKNIGLEYTGNDEDIVFAGEMHSHLIEWYYDDGILAFEETSNGKKKNVWLDDYGRGDPLIKSTNKMNQALMKIFPKAKAVNKNNKRGLRGLRIKPINQESPPIKEQKESINQINEPINQPEKVVNLVNEQIINLSNQLGYKDKELNSLTYDYFSIDNWKSCSNSQKQQLINDLTYKVKIRKAN